MVESKTRKSVFLREAVRALGLQRADVVTGRFEELLARPDLHEVHDLVTLRAVRTEPRVLVTLQAFMKPGGLLFLFKGSGASDPSETLYATPGVESDLSAYRNFEERLVVLEKRTVGPTVSRGTPV
jgi:16S rRNA G527 N7-methylase RsmG